MNDIDQARRHLTLAADALARRDFTACRFHMDQAHAKARLEARTRRRFYDVEVVYRTDRDTIARSLVRVRATSAQWAHEAAQDQVATALELGDRPLTSHLIGD